MSANNGLQQFKHTLNNYMDVMEHNLLEDTSNSTESFRSGYMRALARLKEAISKGEYGFPKEMTCTCGCQGEEDSGLAEETEFRFYEALDGITQSHADKRIKLLKEQNPKLSDWDLRMIEGGYYGLTAKAEMIYRLIALKVETIEIEHYYHDGCECCGPDWGENFYFDGSLVREYLDEDVVVECARLLGINVEHIDDRD